MSGVNKYSFEKGLNQIPKGKVKIVRQAIMNALSITAYTTWIDRLKGNVEPKVSEYDAINQIFKQYNIEDIWGE